jgi:hypothetical protein
MTAQNLTQIVNELEIKMPGVKQRLEPYREATWGIYWNGSIEDVKYLETDKYQVAAAKWEQHLWTEGGGGIEWKEWISLYFQVKGTSEIKSIKGKEIVTRHQYDPQEDLKGLWSYNFASLKHVDENKFEIAWQDREGNLAHGTEQEFDLTRHVEEK